MPGVADVGHVDKRLFTFDISRCAFEVPVTGESLLMPDRPLQRCSLWSETSVDRSPPAAEIEPLAT